jgi:hypothetical protein
MKKDQTKTAGGLARAESLSDERRKEIARKAAQARWGGNNKVEVLAEGPVSLGGQEVPAFVLSDETRVLARAAFVRAIGRQGKVKGGRKYDQELQIPVFLAAKNLKPFITNEIERNSKPIVFTWNGAEMIGYKAEFLLDVCNVFLDAERLGALRPNQAHIADQCRILQRSFAKLGVVGLVDEATGYQRLRSHDALSRLLEQYVEKEIQQWVKTFPDSFYEQLFRLRELDPGENTNRPAYFGHLTNDIVYDRIAPKLREELKNTVPKNEAGRHKHQLHRHLTPDLGHPKLREHIASVVTIMRLSNDWGDFRAKLDAIHPKWNDTMKFDFMAT